MQLLQVEAKVFQRKVGSLLLLQVFRRSSSFRLCFFLVASDIYYEAPRYRRLFWVQDQVCCVRAQRIFIEAARLDVP